MYTAIASRSNTKLSRIQCLSGNQLKMIAVICMLIDHVTKVFFRSIASKIITPILDAGQMTAEQLTNIYDFYDFLCSIGAIAFPVFAFMLAEGFQHTRNKKHYLLRLAAFALLTEFPFDATFFGRYSEGTPGWPWYWYHQNVFFTYLQALYALWMIEWLSKIKFKPLAFLLRGITVASVCYIAHFVIYGDYRGFGVFLIVVAYALRKNRLLQAAGMLLATIIAGDGLSSSFLISLILILLYNGKRGQKDLKLFFYSFYPIHIAIIGFLDWLIFVILGNP
ncbi:MAG: hypothetical protein IJB59_02645 [Oscillospiraceae bacterium]|nr:hypothetical protein [Oscillospiraceae bacterium]